VDKKVSGLNVLVFLKKYINKSKNFDLNVFAPPFYTYIFQASLCSGVHVKERADIKNLSNSFHTSLA